MNRHKYILKELAKFASGLIAADFLFGLWLLSSNLTPFNISNIVFTPSAITAWMIFDVILFIILVHYAWHADVHTPSIGQKVLFITIGVVTGIIGVVHLLRIMFSVTIHIGQWNIPYWPSWIATIVALYLSYSSFRFAAHSKK